MAHLNAALQEAIASFNLFEICAQHIFQYTGRGTSVPRAGAGARSPCILVPSATWGRSLRLIGEFTEVAAVV